MNRKKISQFFNEVQAFSQNFKLPNPLEFYFSVSDMAFRFIDFYKNKFLGENPELDLHTSYLDLIETIHSIIDCDFDLLSKNNNLTTQELANNLYLNKKIIQIYIFAPPCYIPDEYFTNLMNNKFNIHMKYIINYLEEGFYEKINKILSENQYIIAFGINSKQFNVAKENFIEKLRNPDFLYIIKIQVCFLILKVRTMKII